MSEQAVRYTLDQLANHIGAELRGPGEFEVVGIGSIESAGDQEICFLAEPKYASTLVDCRAAAVILTEAMAEHTDRPVLICPSPYLAYAKISQLFDRTPTVPEGVHATASIHPDARVAADASIGPQVVIEQDAVLDSGVQIGAGCVVGARSRLGRGTRLHANVTLYHDVDIGADCIIHSGAVLGADGFGFAPNQGRWERIAQNGGVKIGDGVSIGANTAIDRGAIGDTVVEEGAVIDNLCQIAHNVRIGRFTGIAATCGFAGSAKIGAHCTFAGGAGTVGHIDIADGVHVTGRTMVTKSITERGSWSSGTPMLPTAQWKRAAVRFAGLDKLAGRVALLEKKIGKKT